MLFINFRYNKFHLCDWKKRNFFQKKYENKKILLLFNTNLRLLKYNIKLCKCFALLC